MTVATRTGGRRSVRQMRSTGGEPDVVPAILERDVVWTRLPALALQLVVGRGRFPQREVDQRVVPGAERVVDRPEVEDAKVDRVVAELIDPANRLAQ